MEPAKQLLPVSLVSILASFGPLIRFSGQHYFQSFLGLNWLAGLLALVVVLAAESFVILVPGVLVGPFAELDLIVVELAFWLQVVVVMVARR